MNNDAKKVKIKFHIPDNHKLHFATSVWGGINAKGMLEINFLHDRPPYLRCLQISSMKTAS